MPALCPRQISAFRGAFAKLIMDYRHATEGAGKRDMTDERGSLLPSAYFSLGGRKLVALFLLETCEGLLQVLIQSVARVLDHRQMLGEVLAMPSFDEDVISSFMSAES
jgi:hypothetical protein